MGELRAPKVRTWNSQQESPPPEMSDCDYAHTCRLGVSSGSRSPKTVSPLSPPPTQLVVCATPAGTLGLTVCYDLRFPELWQASGRAPDRVVWLAAVAWVAGLAWSCATALHSHLQGRSSPLYHHRAPHLLPHPCSQRLAWDMGSTILACPSAFTKVTGELLSLSAILCHV